MADWPSWAFPLGVFTLVLLLVGLDLWLNRGRNRR